MLRKTLFWGLTLMLVAIIVSLIFRSRREEKSQAAQAVEIVRQSQPTATRVLAPQDLVIVESKMNLVKSVGEGRKGAAAHHEVVVRNDGSVEYASLQLRFAYLGPGDRVLGTKTYIAVKPVPPHGTESLGDIIVEDVPLGAVACIVRIPSADLSR